MRSRLLTALVSSLQRDYLQKKLVSLLVHIIIQFIIEYVIFKFKDGNKFQFSKYDQFKNQNKEKVNIKVRVTEISSVCFLPDNNFSFG